MTLLLGVLAASVLGSVHCAAMCGAFVCTYAAPGARTAGFLGNGAGMRAHAAYHVGRLVSYASLGAVAGVAGRGADELGALAGIARGAAILGGALMVVWAVSALAATAGARAAVTTPAWITHTLGAALARIRGTPPVSRAAMVGLLTTLLPCGWLYAFVASAATTGNAGAGAAMMAVFWAGTVPALLAVGVGAQRVLGPFARRLPAASAVVVLVLGVFAIAGRLTFAPAGQASGTHQHGSATSAR